MRRLLTSASILLALIIPALAQDTTRDLPAAGEAAPDQRDPLKDATQEIQQRIQARLAKAGFTNIQIVANSFLVIAKDRDGHPVTMMASPSIVTQLDDSRPAQGGESDDVSPSDPPATTGQDRL
jgi:peptidoglycan hydrolase-like protein with peptidoglycan-binding domain